MNDQERIAWAINWIKENKNLKDFHLAKQWGVDKSTVAAYIECKGIAKGKVLSSIVKDYGFSGEWLIAGKGEPFPGASKQYPGVCGPPGLNMGVLDPPQLHKSSDAMFSSDQKINIEEAMGKAYKVLGAGTALSVALFMNIQQFAAALDTGEALKSCQDQMKTMQEQINALNARIDGLTAPSTAERQAGTGSEKEAM